MKETLDPAPLIARLDQLRDVPARDPQAAATGRAEFLREARALQEAVSSAPTVRLKRGFGRSGARGFSGNGWSSAPGHALVFAVAVFVLLFGGAVATAHAAQDSLPGNPLYPVKTGLERAQLALSQDQAHNAELHLMFAEKRLGELAGLVEDRRFDQLTGVTEAFEAHLQSAVQDLGSIAETEPDEAKRLASAVTDSMTRFVDILNGLTPAIPPESQDALVGALESSRQQVELELVGLVKVIDPGVWAIVRTDDGETLQVRITSYTEIEDGLALDDLVKVKVIAAADGSLLGLEIERVDESAPDGDASEATQKLDDVEEMNEGEQSSPTEDDNGEDEDEDKIETEDENDGAGVADDEGHSQDEHEYEHEQEHDGEY